jgi:hypothetical protein
MTGSRLPFVLRFLAASAIALLAQGSALAQCCLGAQDCDHTSASGRYRVRATSQTGTGPQAHGPYHFAFSYEERDADGSWRKLGAFERSWDTKAHFSMTVCASPTGNGFLLSTSMDGRVLLLGTDGRTLQDAIGGRADAKASLWTHDDREPELHVSVDDESLRGRVFVPFAEVHDERAWSDEDRAYTRVPAHNRFAPGDEVRRFRIAMLAWSEKQGAVEAPRVKAAIAQLRSDDPAIVKSGRDALLELGLSARAPVATAAANATGKSDATFLARLVAVAHRLAELACGHDAPHKNLDLLVATLGHPDSELRAAAAGRLRRILPEGTEPSPAWLEERSGELRWDEEAGAFVKIR